MNNEGKAGRPRGKTFPYVVQIGTLSLKEPEYKKLKKAREKHNSWAEALRYAIKVAYGDEIKD